MTATCAPSRWSIVVAGLRDLIGVEIATRVHFSGDRSGGGPAFFKAADAHGLEGIVSKRADSRYRSGRSDAWLKIKSFTVGDFAVLGVERSAAGVPVALLASLGKNPAYVGNAMVTLPTKERDRFWRSVETMGTPQARLAGLARNKKGDMDTRRPCGPRAAPQGARTSSGTRRSRRSTSASYWGTISGAATTRTSEASPC